MHSSWTFPSSFAPVMFGGLPNQSPQAMLTMPLLTMFYAIELRFCRSLKLSIVSSVDYFFVISTFWNFDVFKKQKFALPFCSEYDRGSVTFLRKVSFNVFKASARLDFPSDTDIRCRVGKITRRCSVMRNLTAFHRSPGSRWPLSSILWEYFGVFFAGVQARNSRIKL